MNERIRQLTEHVVPVAHEESPRGAAERRDQHGLFTTLDDVQPRACDGVVLHALDADVDGAAAPDAKAEDGIFLEIVGGDDGLAGRDHARRGVCNSGFQAPARHHALVGAVLPNDDARALSAIRAATDAHDGGDSDTCSGGARLSNDAENPFGLAPIHDQPLHKAGKGTTGRRFM